MSLNSGESLLCVVHYPSNTGFAWNYIEGLYADVADALAAAAVAASAGAQATISMQALKGRASYLGPRSVGHEDPGAASTAIIMGALSDVAQRQDT